MSKLLVAAIDFGTTFSGYAFSFMSDYKTDPLKISANNAWNAGGQCLLSLKTPTVLYYDPNAEKNKQILFGYEAQNAYLTLTQNDDKTLHKKVFYFSLFKMQLYGDKVIMCFYFMTHCQLIYSCMMAETIFDSYMIRQSPFVKPLISAQ